MGLKDSAKITITRALVSHR